MRIYLRESIHHLSHAARVVESRKGDHRRNLEQTDLESVGGSDFHTGPCLVSFPSFARAKHLPQRNVSAQGKRHGIHKLCRVGHKGKQADPKELLVDSRALQDDIDDFDEDFWNGEVVDLAGTFQADQRPTCDDGI